MSSTYPKRLIEVDLPIKRISAHARREKSIRHGHISTLHIWWARRPLAACRAVICAALWPDPADPQCPPAFRTAAASIITEFAAKAASDKSLAAGCDPETWKKWCAVAKPGHRYDLKKDAGLKSLRVALLDFIADFSNWDNSTVPAYLEASRALTQSAHEALGGAPGTRPLVVDPFAGGGSIPLEALRVGADAFASDPDGIGVIVFASKTTASWEAILKAVVDAGWIITGSWPIDTEMEARVAAQGQSRLASSVHLVCRPRENSDGSVRTDEVGDWRDVLTELPRRIHEWMPRLAEEGVVGADAIFACLGPALEIFSRYSRVEKANGETVTLKEYLEKVWAAVAQEALGLIFSGADATGFEEDARLTAMWLWTLKTEDPSPRPSPARGEGGQGGGGLDAEAESDDEDSGKKAAAGGFVLEFDAARKIAQGLGAHLEDLSNLVEVKGEIARLLPVGERALYLWGKDAGEAPRKKQKKEQQLSFLDVIDHAEEQSAWEVKHTGKLGETVLDRIHQSMILFAAGRGEALKRFLVEDGVGKDQRFWRLAQALSALYPPATDEKRWVDGVLARKKGMGY